MASLTNFDDEFALSTFEHFDLHETAMTTTIAIMKATLFRDAAASRPGEKTNRRYENILWHGDGRLYVWKSMVWRLVDPGADTLSLLL